MHFRKVGISLSVSASTFRHWVHSKLWDCTNGVSPNGSLSSIERRIGRMFLLLPTISLIVKNCAGPRGKGDAAATRTGGRSRGVPTVAASIFGNVAHSKPSGHVVPFSKISLIVKKDCVGPREAACRI